MPNHSNPRRARRLCDSAHCAIAFCLIAVWAEGRAAALPTGVDCVLFYDTSAIHYTEPVWFGAYPGREGSFLVGELGGGLHLMEPRTGGYRSVKFGQVATEKLSGNDGLLGLAFHPGFKLNHKYYVYYIQTQGTAVLEERMAAPDFGGDAGTARVLLRYAFGKVVHNGGDMHFGPDGMLYLGLGDAGNPLVYNARSQDLGLYAGKMLRIDVDGRDPGLEYAIPDDNPFSHSADPAIKREIYAYGLRQPWRWNFDPLDGRMVVGDVGDWVAEEVDIVRKGGNYGWSIMEGNSCFNRDDELTPLASCDTAGLIPPVAVIMHTPVSTAPTACIIGGFVFRGDAASPFYGSFIFGDWTTYKLYAVRLGSGPTGAGTGAVAEIGSAPEAISSFGTDTKGNIYVLGIATGVIRRLDHPALVGNGVAIRPVPPPPMLRSPRRGIRGWRLEPGSLPAGADLSILALDGRRLLHFSAAQAAAGADLELPQGVYVGRTAAGNRTGAFPLVLR